MKPKPFCVLNHFTMPVLTLNPFLMRDEPPAAMRDERQMVEIGGKVVSLRTIAMGRGQVVRPKLDRAPIAHVGVLNKAHEACLAPQLTRKSHLWLDSTDLGEASGELALYLSLSASDPILARGDSK